MVRLRLIAAALLAAAGMGGASAAQLAQLQPGERPLAGSTEAELWYGMEQAEKQIRQSPSVVHDPALQAYVEGLVCKVAGAHCGELRVYVVDIPVFNASMAPNGATMVFTGALLLESFFGIPGLGSMTVDAIRANDFSTLRTMVYLGALLFIFGQLLTDVSYALADPRVRLS